MSEHSMNRREFLGTAATAGVLSPFLLRGAENPVNRMAYDISRFSVTNPKLISYDEQARYTKVAERPRRIRALPNGGFLLACAKGVLEFKADGTQVRQFPTPAPARCVAMNRSGVVYAATREGIHLFDKDAKQTAFWPVADSKTWITSLASDGDVLFAADSGNRVVLLLDAAGHVTAKIGAKNKDRNVPGIVLPSPYLDVKLGPDGLLRVNNTGRHCVEVYTKEGDLELSWGKFSAAIEGFCGCCNPVAVDMLPDGRYVTCEKGLPRVKIHSPQGEFQSVVAGPETFPENARHGGARDAVDGTMGGLDAAVCGDGKILVLDLVTANVLVMKPRKA